MDAVLQHWIEEISLHRHDARHAYRNSVKYLELAKNEPGGYNASYYRRQSVVAQCKAAEHYRQAALIYELLSRVPGGFEVAEDRSDYITVTSGMSGFFAVHVWWNPEGFWEPYQTGIGRYRTSAEAWTEARAWSESDAIRLEG